LCWHHERLGKQDHWTQTRVASCEIPGTGEDPSSNFFAFPMRLFHNHLSPPTEVCDISNQAAPYHILRDKQEEDLDVGGRFILRSKLEDGVKVVPVLN
jgi:hypothetical protein